MEQEQRSEMVTFAKQQFAFLKEEKGFTKPLINRSDYALLIYRSATMGIRIEMDVYLSRMEITIGKLGSDGKFPFNQSNFPVGFAGRERTLWLLESLLIRQLHVQDERILALDQFDQDNRRRKRDYEWDYEQWKQVISLYQGLLRDHIDLIVQQPLEVLFPTAIEYLSQWSTLKEAEQLAYEHFAFLGEHGFQPGPVFSVYAWLDIYTWLSADRGIQLSIDNRDMGVCCYVVRLIDGKIPTDDDKMVKKYDHYIQGEEAEVGLIDVLRKRLRIRDAEINRVGNLEHTLDVRHWSDFDYRYVSTSIIGYASLVRRYIKVLMEAPLETLFAHTQLR